MLQFLADENLNDDIVRGLLRRRGDLNVARVRDVGLSGTDDPTVLEWAAQAQRVVLTHDVSTMTGYAYQRVEAGLSMPGVFEIRRKHAVGHIIDDILLLADCSLENEWEGRVLYLPL